jgi:hypothetical protein
MNANAKRNCSRYGISGLMENAQSMMSACFTGKLERAFPHLLNRRSGDPYQHLMSDLAGHVEEKKR